MNRKFLIAGSIYGLFAVMLGAFAAHGLKGILSSDSLHSFETGVRFQMYHALLLLVVGSFKSNFLKLFTAVFYLICLGILFFSGSIYLLATNDLSGIDFTSIALMTPLGGSFLIIAWILLVVNFIKLKNK